MTCLDPSLPIGQVSLKVLAQQENLVVPGYWMGIFSSPANSILFMYFPTTNNYFNPFFYRLNNEFTHDFFLQRSLLLPHLLLLQHLLPNRHLLLWIWWQLLLHTTQCPLCGVLSHLLMHQLSCTLWNIKRGTAMSSG